MGCQPKLGEQAEEKRNLEKGNTSEAVQSVELFVLKVLAS